MIKWERYSQSPECTNNPYGPCPAPWGCPHPAHSPGPHFSSWGPSAPAPAVLQQGWSAALPCAAMGPTKPGPPTSQQPGLGLSLSPGRCQCLRWGCPGAPPAAPLLTRVMGWALAARPCPATPGEPPWLWVPGPEGAPVPRSSLAGTLGNVQSGSCSFSCIPDPEMSRETPVSPSSCWEGGTPGHCLPCQRSWGDLLQKQPCHRLWASTAQTATRTFNVRRTSYGFRFALLTLVLVTVLENDLGSGFGKLFSTSLPAARVCDPFNGAVWDRVA